MSSLANRAWLFGMTVLVAAGLGSGGCATGTKQVQTPRYTLNHPDFWNVKSVGKKDGEATLVVIGSYGSAIIDEGSGAISDRQQNYEAVQADVEARVFAWPEPAGMKDPSEAVLQLLSKNQDLQLWRHSVIAEQPPECGVLKKKYTVLSTKQEPLDMVSRPGWRTIVVGGASGGVLVGVVTRVEFEQDMGRFCHNLSNMQVQLQNLLDGLTVGQANGAAAQGASGAPAPAAGAAPAAGGGAAGGAPSSSASQ